MQNSLLDEPPIRCYLMFRSTLCGYTGDCVYCYKTESFCDLIGNLRNPRSAAFSIFEHMKRMRREASHVDQRQG